LTVHRWRGRILSVLSVVLFGQAGKARADHFFTHPATSDRRTTTGQKAIVALLPAARPARRNAAELFKNRTEITIEGDVKVYITPRKIPEHDRFLKAYSTETAGKVGSVVPGLLSVMDQVYRAQIRREGKGAYTLADAMRDAIWRKNMADNLRTCCPRVRPPVRTARRPGAPLQRLASGPHARAPHLTLVDCVQEGSDVWKD
jgi:hypothetical protein